MDLINPPKIYVDLGCFDPSQCSNTLLLHKSGWRGVDIDLDPARIRRFEASRPLDHNVVAALSDTAGRMRAFRYPQPTTDCIRDYSDPESISALCEEPLGVEIIHTTTISTIIEGLPSEMLDVGYLNIDCEAHDFRVLRGSDLEKFKPWIITVESLQQKQIFKYSNIWLATHTA